MNLEELIISNNNQLELPNRYKRVILKQSNKTSCYFKNIKLIELLTT